MRMWCARVKFYGEKHKGLLNGVHRVRRVFRVHRVLRVKKEEEYLSTLVPEFSRQESCVLILNTSYFDRS